ERISPNLEPPEIANRRHRGLDPARKRRLDRLVDATLRACEETLRLVELALAIAQISQSREDARSIGRHALRRLKERRAAHVLAGMKARKPHRLEKSRVIPEDLGRELEEPQRIVRRALHGP